MRTNDSLQLKIQFLALCFIPITSFAFISLPLAQTETPCGTTQTGQIITLGQEDIYTFYAAVNDCVTIRLIRTSATGMDPYLKLCRPDGSLIVQ